jgi:hypothetical protein
MVWARSGEAGLGEASRSPCSIRCARKLPASSGRGVGVAVEIEELDRRAAPPRIPLLGSRAATSTARWRPWFPPGIPLLGSDRPRATPGAATRDTAALQTAIERAIGGPERIYQAAGGIAVLVRAAALAQHLDPSRGSFVPLLPEILEDPFEVWESFERHRGSGRIALRRRFVKVLALDRDRFVVAIAQTQKGHLEAWTVVVTDRERYLRSQRRGRLR